MIVTMLQSQIKPVKMWMTKVTAIDPFSGDVKTYDGPLIPGVTRMDAEQYCEDHGLEYCEIVGVLVEREVVFEIGLN